MRRHAALYKLIVLNALFTAALAYAYQAGWVALLWSMDTTWMTPIILGLFSLGLLSTFWKGFQVSYVDPMHLSDVPFAQRELLEQEVNHIWQISQWLTYLGLIGTVIGLLNSLQAMTTSQIDVQGVLAGLRIGFGTTITGATLGLWTEINHVVLKTATVRATQ